ncbi:two-component system, chemotaxis family, CheB/CheR fusion protein [Malonomonas rubra DSM 5091]|uniref:protein-glutamate O-methyltransferase n=1 Tax=Malonomonas rubra DSM 5091 TaxID=1122189 RepID=A0A1M6FP78_MALRU|nr:chemotaxis protein CheB [Malonomonas rubra]SHI99521.1 two-component system, chemotaxis family, CheB/CheR fusion protein [Malonomonas rubra DSM 5091]
MARAKKSATDRHSSSQTEESVKKRPRSFPVVGIGASAGGLEALEQFFANVPADSGLAYIVVQHLDPVHDSLLASLIQENSSLPVAQVTDDTRIEPNHVYVIPPNKDMSLLHGVLHLLEPAAPAGLRLPIDFLLTSLADDCRELSIAVILSGMGSDGSQALRKIKESSGAIFVQEPTSAKFDSMPRSAIETDLVDIVAPAEELPGEILSYLRSVRPLATKTPSEIKGKDKSGLQKIILLLRTQTGHDFTDYKKSTLYRRIERRKGLHQLATMADYIRYLRENPQETKLLFKELMIGVTSFFRDQAVWQDLRQNVLPQLLKKYPNGGELRAWVTGCSTGEEAYSLAILFRELLDDVKPSAPYSLQIFATDLDQDAIEKARTGAYPTNIISDLSDERLRRFFIQDERGYRVRQEIREMVIFASQNVIMDPPFTKLDLLTCRNLLIYIEPALQAKLLALFHYSLKSEGFLVLGNAETIGKSRQLFTPLPGKNRIYQKHSTTEKIGLMEFPDSFAEAKQSSGTVTTSGAAAPAPPNLQTLTDSLLLRNYTPAAVLTTREGDIVYISGKTGKYLEPATGKANLNIFAMAREGLGSLLHETFFRALRGEEKAVQKAVSIGTNGGTQTIDLEVLYVSEPQELRGMLLIVFRDLLPVAKPKRVSAAGTDDVRLSALSLELQQSREELQTTREEMQSSQEELKSANEELQSTNEELQSTNEELTTSKEEMQSMNEELQTVNHELQAKVDELSQVSDDMNNLLNSTEIATLFLDDGLRVRRFTPETTKIINLIPGDAGRPITDIVSKLDYPELETDIHQVLRSLSPSEKLIPAEDQHWYTVRIMPYRTQDNRIDGVVITFINASSFKRNEADLSEALNLLNSDLVQTADNDEKKKVYEVIIAKINAVLEQLKK